MRGFEHGSQINEYRRSSRRSERIDILTRNSTGVCLGHGTVIRLFDSVLREYPIGAFLIWRLKGTAADDQIKYEFIRNYIEDSVYPEDPRFDHVDHHNPKIPPVANLPEQQQLVLDGQQRLTAFLIGLNGTFTEKRKYVARHHVDAWNEKRLYMNIFSDPNKDVEDELGLKYEFAFKVSQPAPTSEEYWYPVGEILDVEEGGAIQRIVETELGINDFPRGKLWDASQNLSKLYSAIHDDTGIQYHEERTTNQERVLDIFIRTNDGGTPLSKSEILLSMATARWTEGEESIDARKQITSFVDSLNERHRDKNFNFSIDFVLKSLLVLSDRDPEYRIANFTNENLGKMRETWLEGSYKSSVEAALDLVVEFGLNKRSLTSYNALIPIAYFIDHHNPSLDWDAKYGAKTRRRTHYWLSSALLNGTFNSRPDEVLEDAREAIKNSNDGFPLEEIHRRMRGRGKVVGFSEDVVETLLEETNYRSQKSFLLLSLLYFPDPIRRGADYQRDHIFPKSLLDAGELIDDRGFDPRLANRCQELADKVANLQLLTSEANPKKNDEEFEEWLKTRNEEYYERHLVPRDEELYKIENFPDFVAAREELIRGHMRETFAEFA